MKWEPRITGGHAQRGELVRTKAQCQYCVQRGLKYRHISGFTWTCTSWEFLAMNYGQPGAAEKPARTWGSRSRAYDGWKGWGRRAACSVRVAGCWAALRHLVLEADATSLNSSVYAVGLHLKADESAAAAWKERMPLAPYALGTPKLTAQRYPTPPINPSTICVWQISMGPSIFFIIWDVKCSTKRAACVCAGRVQLKKKTAQRASLSQLQGTFQSMGLESDPSNSSDVGSQLR